MQLNLERKERKKRNKRNQNRIYQDYYTTEFNANRDLLVEKRLN